MVLCVIICHLTALLVVAESQGAASTDPSQSGSSYNNANNRPDPFLPVRLKGRGPDPVVTVNEGELHLQGILWHPTRPVAVVNRQRVFLNDTVTIRLNSGEHSVKAIAIEREKVVLKVDDRQVELVLER